MPQTVGLNTCEARSMSFSKRAGVQHQMTEEHVIEN